jgi:hypothetical protein
MNYEFFSKYHTEKDCNLTLGYLIERGNITFDAKKEAKNVMPVL